MNKIQVAKITYEKILKRLGLSYQRELADFLGIKPPTISEAINKDGRVPESWFEKIQEKKGVTRGEIIATELSRDEIKSILEVERHVIGQLNGEEKTTSIADISIKEQGKPVPTVLGDTGPYESDYVKLSFNQLCTANLRFLFPYIKEFYGEDAVAIERFKFEMLNKMPDLRQWLYGEDEKKVQNNNE